MSSEPSNDKYDVVVVGSGLGGLTAAALLAKGGKRLLVAEQQAGAGGYAHSFQRGPFSFDPAIHGIAPGKRGSISAPQLLDMLGVSERCTFIPFHNPLYQAVLPGFRLDVPLGVEEFIEAHVQHFPDQEKGLRTFMDRCVGVIRAQEATRAEFSLRELGDVADSVSTLLQYRLATVSEVLDDCVDDSHLKTLLTVTWTNMGVPPSKAAFPVFAGMLIPTLENGRLYCQGSFQNLVNALVTALQQNGGELLLRSRVDRILLEDETAVGVRLEDGTEIRARTVISNADARQTFGDLIGFDHLPDSYVKRLLRMRPSLSAFQVYAATKADLNALGGAHETWWYRSWDHEESYRENLAGHPYQVAMSVPSRLDATLAPSGQHVSTIVALMPFDIGRPWSDVRESLVDQILAAVEDVFPGFRENLTLVESATPAAMYRYTLNYQGAAYGWENTPQQVGSKRLSNKTPIKDLYLSGHWAQPAFGGLGVMYSGMQVAQLILGISSTDELARALNS